jgi:predicted RNase H-like nuclease (RuvC/YqgF family)
VIDKLTKQFLKQEEENFALFSYVNELNDELEGLQTRVTQLRTAIDEARELNVHRGEQQAETLETVAHELQVQTNYANATEKKLTEVFLLSYISHRSHHTCASNYFTLHSIPRLDIF